MNKISLADDSSKDHLIEQFIKDPLYKIKSNGKIYTKLTVNGQGVTDKWREIGYKKFDGYVRCRYKDDHLFVHRIVFRKFHGPIKPGYTIDHLDKNNSNNHPDNFKQKSQGENNKNKSKKYKKKKKGYIMNVDLVNKVKLKIAENEVDKKVGDFTFKQFKQALDRVETSMGESNPAIQELAYAVAKLVEDSYGSHNFSEFKKFLNNYLK